MGVCGCVVGERAWLHPSDWRRLLPCLLSLTGQLYDWGREVGRFSLICPGKEKEEKKDTSSLPRLFRKPLPIPDLSSSSFIIYYFLFWRRWGIP